MTVTRQQVADIAHVSPATVSKAFNRPETVRPTTRERVLTVAARHGYTPNKAASALRRNGSGNILLLTSAPIFQYVRVYGLFQAEAVNAVVETVNPSPYTLVMRSFHDSTELRRELESSDSDGIILLDLGVSLEHMELMSGSSKPVVCCAQECSDPSLNRVLTDESGVGWTAGRRLFEAGLRRPAMVNPHLDEFVGRNRLSGFQAAFDDTEVQAISPRRYSDGYTAVRERVGDIRAGNIDCIFAEDLMLSVLLPALMEAGLRIPQDVALIGIDNLRQPLPRGIRPDSVDICIGEVFRRGAEAMLELLAGSRDRVDERIQPRLVPGNTVVAQGDQP